MDYVLLHDWFQYKNNSSVYMVDVNISMALRNNTIQVHEQIASFRNRYTLSEYDSLVAKPVVIVILNFDHYFVTVFDYASRRVYVLGKSIHEQGYTEDLDWGAWGGPTLWERIAMLFGWISSPLDEVEMQGFNWIQVYISFNFFIFKCSSWS